VLAKWSHGVADKDNDGGYLTVRVRARPCYKSRRTSTSRASLGPVERVRGVRSKEPACPGLPAHCCEVPGGGGRDCGHTPPVAVLPRTLQSPQMTANIATCIIHSIGAMPARTVWANFATVCMRFFSLNALPAVFFGISRNIPSHYFAVYSSSSSFFVPEPRLI